MVKKFYDFVKKSLTSSSQMEGFKGTEYMYPLLYGITGVNIPSNEMINHALERVKEEIGGFSGDALWLAELVAFLKDGERVFLVDDAFRWLCVALNEGTNGWALLMGNEEKDTIFRLINELQEKKFRVFVTGSLVDGIEELPESVTSFGPSQTGLIYFAQLLVRYALIYGRVPVGDLHELSHSIEENAPGVIFVVGELSSIERLLVQGMLSLGTPVISLRNTQNLVGSLIVSQTISDMADKAWKLPNIRARLVVKATPDVPVPVGKVFTHEEILEADVGLRLDGSLFSFIIAKPSLTVQEDEVTVLGDIKKTSTFCVLVELGNRNIDDPMTLWIGRILRRVINYAKGIKVKSKGNRIIDLIMTKEALKSGFRPEHLGNLIKTELRNDFPSIGPIHVTFILNKEDAKKMYPTILSFIEERKNKIKNATEESESVFYGCTRCRSFSLAHACTVTPERSSQCGVRPWYMIKAHAILDPGSVYEPCVLIYKGKCLDPLRGEYEGVNRSTERRTEGRVKRIYLHSIFDFPHTACSCFQNIAFHIPEVDGIGLMPRDFKGEAPNGMTWTKLANKVAGRQCIDGVASFSVGYLHSQKFFQGDGGYSRVVWMTDHLKKIAGDSIPEKFKRSIATEKDITTIEELKTFIKKNRPPETL